MPLPITARNSHAAVAVDRDLYIMGGDASGELLKEYAMCDTGDRSAANWLEPILKGDVPSARKAASAIASGNKIFMFGGMAANAEDAVVTIDELVVFEILGPNDLNAVINPPVNGTIPPARAYATMCEYSAGRLFLYGGIDAASKPLNDGWLLDIATMTWEQVFNGHSDLVMPTGSVATLIGTRLVMLNSGVGSPKIDLAASLDFAAIRESFQFTTKMKQDAVAMLDRLEAWTDRQNSGMELAKNPERLSQSFDSLLKVMDSLLQV
jgi:dynein heavy chain